MSESQILTICGVLIPIVLDIVIGALPSSIFKYKGLILGIAHRLYEYGLEKKEEDKPIDIR